MVEFQEKETWEPAPPKAPRGRSAVHVPEVLATWLEKTYRDGKVCTLPVTEEDEGVADLLRTARIYCERQKKKFDHRFKTTDDGSSILAFRMRDPRPYKPRKKKDV